jgi:hypothetical protein
MKPTNGRQSTQLQLTFEADESRIWETLETSEQHQVMEYLARLWIEYVTNQRAISLSSASSEDKS